MHQTGYGETKETKHGTIVQVVVVVVPLLLFSLRCQYYFWIHFKKSEQRYEHKLDPQQPMRRSKSKMLLCPFGKSPRVLVQRLVAKSVQKLFVATIAIGRGSK